MKTSCVVALDLQCTHQELHSQHTSCCPAVAPVRSAACYFSPGWPSVKVVCVGQSDWQLSPSRGATYRYEVHADSSTHWTLTELCARLQWPAAAFPLTSTASWSLLFCTQTLRSRNNRERKWNRRHWKRLIELQYQHDCTQPGSPASIKFDSFKQILFINQNAEWTWRHEAVTAQGSF